MHKLWMYIGLLGFLLPSGAWAQDPYYKVIDESDGLPNNSVYGLFQDAKGFIWIATDDGLCRYDGHSFKRFSSSTQSSKAGANIFEDPYGRIWYENFDGHLFYVSGDTLLALDQPPPTGYVRTGCIGGRLFQAAYPKLNVYDLETLQRIETRENPPRGFGMVGTRGEQKYWLYAGNSYQSFDARGQMEEFILNPDSLGPKGIAFDYAGKVFELQYSIPELGIRVLRGKAFYPFAPLVGRGLIQQHGFGDGKLWICYGRGLEVIDATTGKRFGDHLYFPDKSITAFLIDREGNHWFGTQNEGLMLIPDFTSECIPTAPNGLKRVVNTANGLIVGTQGGELMRYVPEGKHFEVIHSDPSRHAIDFLYADDRYLISGSPLGEIRGIGDWKLTNSIKSALKDAVRIDDRFLAINSSSNSGFLDLAPGDTAHHGAWDAMATAHPNPVFPAVSDNLGGRGRAVAKKAKREAIYFATSLGLQRITPQDITELKFNGKPFYGSQMQAFGERIYALSTLGGLYLIDENDRISEIHDLPTPAPYLRLKVLQGKLYLLGAKHLLQIDISGDRPRVENLIAGLQTSSIHDMAMLEGRLALAADNGLILLDPNQKAIARLPQLHITALRIGGKSFPPDSLAAVEHHQNEIAIDYSILNFRTGGDFPLFYRINEGPWNRTHPDTRQLLLAQLSPGDYHIAFCLGAPGCEAVAMVHVLIRTPFWNQTWFYLLLVLGLVLIAIALIVQRARVVQRRHALKMEKLELENSLRQSTLTAIRSQMNPHFFFNALNTIQAFIFSDDKRNATNYLSKFSKLTRLVLEMSEQEYVSLAEEIEAITLYLELEKSRFGDEFQFQIEVGPGLAVHSLYLPSMIIQPFVENAVKHGLLHRSGLKELRISFQAADKMLVIEVDDNGIGRKRSEELNRLRQERHQSFSVNANKKRIDILNAGLSQIGVAYTDKSDADGTPTGTHVKITLLPMIKAAP